jgi:hypothetical protein
MKVLFIHPGLRTLFFFTSFALCLHKYTHMFICEREIHSPACTWQLILITSSFLSVVLVTWNTAASLYPLWRSHQEIWKISAWWGWELNNAELARVLGGLLNYLRVFLTGKINYYLLKLARRDYWGQSAIEHQWQGPEKLYQSFH